MLLLTTDKRLAVTSKDIKIYFYLFAFVPAVLSLILRKVVTE